MSTHLGLKNCEMKRKALLVTVLELMLKLTIYQMSNINVKEVHLKRPMHYTDMSTPYNSTLVVLISGFLNMDCKLRDLHCSWAGELHFNTNIIKW